VACSLIDINHDCDVVVEIKGPIFPVEWDEMFDFVDTLNSFHTHRLLWTMCSTIDVVRLVVPVEYTEILELGKPRAFQSPFIGTAGQCRSIGLASPSLAVDSGDSR
jgi:hypothetical protein